MEWRITGDKFLVVCNSSYLSNFQIMLKGCEINGKTIRPY